MFSLSIYKSIFPLFKSFLVLILKLALALRNRLFTNNDIVLGSGGDPGIVAGHSVSTNSLQSDNNSDLNSQLIPCPDLVGVFEHQEDIQILSSLTNTTSVLDNLASKILQNCKYYLPSEVKLDSLNNLNILQCNTQSLKTKFDKFQTFLSSMNCTFDIICICETWLDDLIMDYYNLQEYSLVYNNRSNKRGGGVAIYIHKKYNFTIRSDLEINTNDISSKFVELQMPNIKNIVVGTIYRTPNIPINIFLDYLSDLSNKILSDNNKNIFISGDFNIDFLNLSTETAPLNFLDSMLSNFLCPLISLPTRLTSLSKSLIDNIFSNNLNNCQSGCIYSDLSDHSPIFASFRLNTKLISTSQKRTIKYRKITPQSTINFNFELSNNLNRTVFNDNPDYLTETFMNTFNELTNKHFPIKILSKRKTPIQPWITQGILQSIATKNNLYKKLKIKYNIYNENCLSCSKR